MKLLSLALIAAGFALAGSAQADEAMARKDMCLTCHAVDKHKVGPSFKEIAAKYKGDKNAEHELAEGIVKGSKGHFGAMPMSPQPKAAGDAEELAKWIMSL